MTFIEKQESVIPKPGDPLAEVRESGREAGYESGYGEGYLRGRGSVIVNHYGQQEFPVRTAHVLYVSSGKGYPYSPLDEAITKTLQTMVTQLTIIQPDAEMVTRAAELSPDLMLVLDGMYVESEQLQQIRALGIRTAIWLTDDPYYTDMTVPKVIHYDYVFTLELNCVHLYKNIGCEQVHYLPFGVHPEHYRPIETSSRDKRDISFIGSAYWNRVHFFEPIIAQLMEKNTIINGIWWDRLPQYEIYKDRIELGKWMGPLETAEAYNNSKIIINLHRSHVDDSVNNNKLKLPAASPNPRTFEISACGVLQLSDSREDLQRFYVPNEEIVLFDSQQDLLEKIEYYLTHEKERQEIALRALERTFRDHRYCNRLNEMLSIVFP